jgi:hypothetical protein
VIDYYQRFLHLDACEEPVVGLFHSQGNSTLAANHSRAARTALKIFVICMYASSLYRLS